ncbi:hypothetical protein S2M10_28080 [Sphingomonas sp. S2M10]|uniref:PEPxxWA-CTERM sorting domain-containing protein n=1 Tax=Sphingomonas sp. S2M10 TaxID=2705010 RepID=UPI00145666A3|nr:hypothetical protein [Sphingomonas sp. S2M10]
MSGTRNGTPELFDLGFGSASFGFNIGVYQGAAPPFLLSTGTQLYTGSESAPSFKLGSFSLSTGDMLAISAIPEPAGWAMLLAGFGALGLVMRRHRQTRVRVRVNR